MVDRPVRPSGTTQATDLPPDGHPDAIARWERNRAMGRSQFIWRRGVFGWGIPIALVTIAYQVVQEQGFVWRLVMTQHLKTGIGVAMLVFPLCGYLFGRWLWTEGEENYSRLLEAQRKPKTGDRAGEAP